MKENLRSFLEFNIETLCREGKCHEKAHMTQHISVAVTQKKLIFK